MKSMTAFGVAMAMVMVGLVTGGCSEKKLEPRPVVRPVTTYTFGGQKHQLKFTYPGRVYANQTVELAFEVTGKLNELPVKRGQEVKKGELLARLDQRDFRNQRDAVQAQVEEAKATYERYAKASKDGAVAKQQVDEAMARMKIAEAASKVAQKALEDTELRADFDGIIADRYYDNFQNVVAKQPVVSLQDISKLEIRINMPESDVVRGGKAVGRVTAEFAAHPGRKFDLALKEFSTQADSVTQTYLATLIMPMPKDVDVLPGMTATVIWEPTEEAVGKSPLIPAAALGGLPGERTWVWVIQPESMTVSRRDVKIGQLHDGGVVEVLSGLKPGEILAAAGVYLLDEGMKIRKLKP